VAAAGAVRDVEPRSVGIVQVDLQRHFYRCLPRVRFYKTLFRPKTYPQTVDKFPPKATCMNLYDLKVF
jgi:hypothetical protein